MTLFHAPALYLIVAVAIGYFLPLASAKLSNERWYATHPEIEGVFTLVASALTGLAADLIHAATGGADFSWRAWAVAAAAALVSALIGHLQTWQGSRTAARLRGRDMHTDHGRHGKPTV